MPDRSGTPGDDVEEQIDSAASECVRRLRDADVTLATAESLTGGLVGGAITAVPGASAVYRGGVVAYATDLKNELLGVDAGLLARAGAVDPEVARSMATGARTRLGADIGLATTGVAGPSPQDGKSPGTVWVGVATRSTSWAVDVSCAPVGDRTSVRQSAVLSALRELNLLLAALGQPQRRG